MLPSSDVRRYGVETVAGAGRMLHADLAIGGSVQRPPGAPAWLITVSVSDAAHPYLLDSQSIRVEERDAANIDATLTAALVRARRARVSHGHTRAGQLCRLFAVCRGSRIDSGVRKALKLAAAEEGCDFAGLGWARVHTLRRANITCTSLPGTFSAPGQSRAMARGGCSNRALAELGLAASGAFSGSSATASNP